MGARGPKARYTDVACPNEDCQLFGIKGEGNIVSRRTRTTRSGDEVRIFRCNRCGCNFNSRTGTVYQHLHSSQDEFDDARRHLETGRASAALPTSRAIPGHRDPVESEVRPPKSIAISLSTIVPSPSDRMGRNGTGRGGTRWATAYA